MNARLFALSITLFITACAGPVPKIDASQKQLAAVKTVAVVRPPEPKTYTVLNFGHPGMAFGIIGGLVAGADQASKQSRLSAALQSQGTDINNRLANQIASKLALNGYDTKVIDAPWEETDGRYTLPFDKIQSDADAVLLVSPTIVGFIATGVTSDYLPTVAVVVTLLGSDHKEQLYRGFHVSGWAPKADGWKVSPPQGSFANFDALMSDIKGTVAALDQAGVAISETVNTDLRR